LAASTLRIKGTVERFSEYVADEILWLLAWLTPPYSSRIDKQKTICLPKDEFTGSLLEPSIKSYSEKFLSSPCK
jgi:hypothetical protein